MATPGVGGNNPDVKHLDTKPAVHGEQISRTETGKCLVRNNHNRIFKNDEVFKDIGNLLGTEAGNKALEMAKESHEKYGTKPGMISAEVWNPYAKAHGGKEISGSISLKDAMNSITTYTVRKQTEAKKAQAEELRANSETGEKPEQGI